jgi:uncharacterized protein (TIGR03083 family)
MTGLSRPQLIHGLSAEYTAFACLVAALTETEWRTPTRCSGWQVRDVAAHVTGNAADSADGTIGSRSPDEQARALRGCAPSEIATTLHAANTRLRRILDRLPASLWDAPSAVPGRTIGNGVLTLWYDAFVHGDDIRDALGQETPRGPGRAASVQWLRGELTRQGWSPATLALDGLTPLTIGTGGPLITGDPLRFILIASGRGDPAAFGLDDSVNVHSPR